MNATNILVIDSDPKNLQILKESLESYNFKVMTINNGIDAWEIILSQKPELIVCEVEIPGLNGFELHERLQNNPVAASIPMIFLTNRRNLEDRIKSLRTGVKDYMIKPLHVKEVIARLKMIQRRIERVKNAESESTRNVVGRLEEKSVEDLVENYGAERKTGVLALYDNNNLSGEIYFRDGTVVNARLGNFKAEKAVYQMLPWKIGHFVMTFKEVNVEDEITVSNLGLLLQGFKRLQDREKLIKQLPSLETIFVKTAIFAQILKKKSISADALKFIDLFNGKRTISKIIAESIYDDIKTVEKITKLYHQGFIRPLSDGNNAQRISEKLSISESGGLPGNEQKEVKSNYTPEFEIHEKKAIFPEETSDLRVSPKLTVKEEIKPEKIQIPNKKYEEQEVEPFNFGSEHKQVQESQSVNGKAKKEEEPVTETTPGELDSICDALFNGHTTINGKLVIISADNQCRKDFISTLTVGQFSAKPISSDGSESFEVGRIVTSRKHKLELLGLSTERKFLQMLDQMSPPLMGYIILVSGGKSSNLGYFGYLVNSLKQKFKVPHVVAVYHPSQNKPIPLDIIRHLLRIDAKEQLVEIDVQEIESIKHLLKQLKTPEYR